MTGTPKHLAVHIDRVVVDAPHMRPHEATRVEVAMRNELTQLFANAGPSVAADSVRERIVNHPSLARANRAADIGREIARAIHTAVMERR